MFVLYSSVAGQPYCDHDMDSHCLQIKSRVCFCAGFLLLSFCSSLGVLVCFSDIEGSFKASCGACRQVIAEVKSREGDYGGHAYTHIQKLVYEVFFEKPFGLLKKTNRFFRVFWVF